MRRHQRMDVWKLGMTLVEEIYQLTRSFPDGEKYGLVSQMRRAAVSIPSNIAEGAARGGDKEFCRFLLIARGSLAELETQVEICRRLGLVNDVTVKHQLLEHLYAKLNNLIKVLAGEKPSSASSISRPAPSEEAP